MALGVTVARLTLDQLVGVQIPEGQLNRVVCAPADVRVSVAAWSVGDNPAARILALVLAAHVSAQPWGEVLTVRASVGNVAADKTADRD